MKTGKILSIAALLFLLTACGRNIGAADVSNSDTAAVTENVTPTGYPAGEVQRPSLWYHGALYLYNAEGFDLPLENGFEKIGIIETVDNGKYPSEDFHASRLEGGQEVYGKPEALDKLYVRYSGGYALFEREEEKSTAEEQIKGQIKEQYFPRQDVNCKQE